MKRLIVAAATAALLAGQAQAAAPKKAHAGGAATRAPAKGWVYKDIKTEMGASRHVACALSEDQVKLHFPYQPTKARLCVEALPLSNTTAFSVYVELLNKGQIVFSEGANFKFDDGTLVGSGADDSSAPSGQIIFLKRSAAVIRPLKHSKSVAVGLHFFDDGYQFLHFNTADLQFPKPGLEQDEVKWRDEDLKNAGGDQAKIDAINAKYNCIADERTDCPK